MTDSADPQFPLQSVYHWLNQRPGRSWKVSSPSSEWHRLWLWWPTGPDSEACVFADGPTLSLVVADALSRSPA